MNEDYSQPKLSITITDSKDSSQPGLELDIPVLTLTFVDISDPKILLSLTCCRQTLSSIPYFHNLFTFPGSRCKSEFTLKVEDPHVCSDLIRQICGEKIEYKEFYPAWLYALRTLLLKDYFSLPLEEKDMRDIYSLEIPPGEEEITYFFQTLEILNINKVDILRRNWKLRRVLKSDPAENIRKNLPEEFLLVLAKNPYGALLGCGKDILWVDPENILVKTFSDHGDLVRGIQLLPDNEHFLSISHDMTIKLWNMNSGQDSQGVYEGSLLTFVGHTHWITVLQILPDGEHFLSGSADKTIKLWSLKSDQNPLHTFTGHTDWIRVIRILSDGENFLSAGDDGTIRLWNLKTGQSSFLFETKSPINTLHILPGWGNFIFGSKDGKIKYGNVKSGLSVYINLESSVGRKEILQILPLPDKENFLLVVFSSVWKLNITPAKNENDMNHLLYKWEYCGWHLNRINAVEILPDGKSFLSASDDGRIKLWRLNSAEKNSQRPAERGLKNSLGDDPKPVRIFTGHTNYVNTIKVLSDGEHFLSASSDRTLKLWNINHENCIRSETLSGSCSSMISLDS